MIGFKNRRVLVTGASGGIGRATAVEFATAGARVAVHGFRNIEAAKQTAELVRMSASVVHEPVVVTGDLSDPKTAHQVVDAAVQNLGGIDILVNNAGDLIERRALADMDIEFFDRVIGANVHSALFCTQAAAKVMIEAGEGGAIVNMGSLAAWNGGGPGSAAYSTAKGAVVSLTKALAKELAPKGIRVNCVSPGLIGQTDFHARFTKPEAFEAATKGIPLGKPGEPVEVARVITFLASEASSFLVGETIEINGGMYLR
ncbi:MAG: glucose 1-dehydrogenase [Myxococcota bacterium]